MGYIVFYTAQGRDMYLESHCRCVIFKPNRQDAKIFKSKGQINKCFKFWGLDKTFYKIKKV